MQIVAPDLLVESRGLSLFASSTALLLGLLLWGMGWRIHRFWIVLLGTLAGGLAGLNSSATFGVQPLVAGLLAALAAGVLALALVRLVAFVAGGLLACMLVHAYLPSWEQPLISGLIGGLIGIFLFRVWTMLLTSLIGTLLVAYSALSLGDRLGTLNSVELAASHAVLLNWLWGSVALVGLLTQFLLDRRRARLERQREEQEKVKEKEAKEKAAKEEERKKAKAAASQKPWWSRAAAAK